MKNLLIYKKMIELFKILTNNYSFMMLTVYINILKYLFFLL
jgi:hypothetical protein